MRGSPPPAERWRSISPRGRSCAREPRSRWRSEVSREWGLPERQRSGERRPYERDGNGGEWREREREGSSERRRFSSRERTSSTRARSRSRDRYEHATPRDDHEGSKEQRSCSSRERGGSRERTSSGAPSGSSAHDYRRGSPQCLDMVSRQRFEECDATTEAHMCHAADSIHSACSFYSAGLASHGCSCTNASVTSASPGWLPGEASTQGNVDTSRPSAVTAPVKCRASSCTTVPVPQPILQTASVNEAATSKGACEMVGTNQGMCCSCDAHAVESESLRPPSGSSPTSLVTFAPEHPAQCALTTQTVPALCAVEQTVMAEAPHGDVAYNDEAASHLQWTHQLDALTSAQAIEEALLLRPLHDASSRSARLSPVCRGVVTGGPAACTSWEAAGELLRAGVTHVILSVADGLPDPPVPAGDPPLISQRVPLRTHRPECPDRFGGSAPVIDEDAAAKELHLYFEPAAAAIRAGVDAGGRAAVLCDSEGGWRAGAICAYYLMRHEGCCLRQALDRLTISQSCALPPIKTLQRLIEAEAVLFTGTDNGKPTTEALSADEIRWRVLDYVGALSPWATREGAAVLLLAGRDELKRQLELGLAKAKSDASIR